MDEAGRRIGTPRFRSVRYGERKYTRGELVQIEKVPFNAKKSNTIELQYGIITYFEVPVDGGAC